MSEEQKYDEVPNTQVNVYDETAARLKQRDEHLTRRLRRMRIIVRILDLGFGFVPPPDVS